MKAFVIALCVALVVVQDSSAQCIRGLGSSLLDGCGCGCGVPACASPILAPAAIPAIIQSNSVASSLADTLSLLTVSSLLAESLPLNPNIIVAPSCGCGYGGYGYGGYGYGGCGYGGCGYGGCGYGGCGYGGCGCGGLYY